MKNLWGATIAVVLVWLTAVVAINAHNRPTQPPQWEGYQNRAAAQQMKAHP